MYVFPSEVQLDIFKFLNSDQLSSIKQTNFYFKNFINEYVNELARKEFDRLEIVIFFINSIIFIFSFILLMIFHAIILNTLKQNRNFMTFNQMTNLRKRLKICFYLKINQFQWISGIEKSIPMFLNVTETYMHIRVSTRSLHGNF